MSAPGARVGSVVHALVKWGGARLVRARARRVEGRCSLCSSRDDWRPERGSTSHHRAPRRGRAPRRRPQRRPSPHGPRRPRPVPPRSERLVRQRPSVKPTCSNDSTSWPRPSPSTRPWRPCRSRCRRSSRPIPASRCLLRRRADRQSRRGRSPGPLATGAEANQHRIQQWQRAQSRACCRRVPVAGRRAHGTHLGGQHRSGHRGDRAGDDAAAVGTRHRARGAARSHRDRAGLHARAGTHRSDAGDGHR